VSLSDLDFLHQTLASQSSIRPTENSGRTSEGTTDSIDELPITGSPSSEGSTPTPSLATLQATTTSTNAALDSTTSPGEGEELSDLDLEKMLERLNEAEGAADDLEGRLDGLLGNLDQMLSLLGVNPENFNHEEEEQVPEEDLGKGEPVIETKEDIP